MVWPYFLGPDSRSFLVAVLEMKVGMQDGFCRTFSRNEYVGKCWPNGEFGFSRARRFNPAINPVREASEDEQWTISALRVHGLSKTVRAFAPSGETAEFLSLGTAQVGAIALGSSNLIKSHKTRRGEKGLSSYAGKMLRNGCFLLEEKFGKDRLSFLTLTLPDLADEDWERVINGWGEILRVFFQWLTRKQVANNLEPFFVSCTEVQPKRFESSGKLALHIHCVFLGRRRKHGWILTPKQIRQAWKRALSRFLTKSLDTYNWTATEQVVRVRRSVAAYLSKYISKGNQNLLATKSTSSSMSLPRSWWNCSLLMKRWISRMRIPIDGLSVELLKFWEANSVTSKLIYIRLVKIQIPAINGLLSNVQEMTVGSRGCLTQSGVADLRILKRIEAMG